MRNHFAAKKILFSLKSLLIFQDQPVFSNLLTLPSWQRLAFFDYQCFRLTPFATSWARMANPCSCNSTGQYICSDTALTIPLHVIEEHGKIAVAQMPHTGTLVRAHGVDRVQVSALGYDLIRDQDYIRRLLGQTYGTIDCILQVTWPTGQRIYIEVMLTPATADREATFEYISLTVEEFESQIASASPADRAIFYANINADQTYVRPHLSAHLSTTE